MTSVVIWPCWASMRWAERCCLARLALKVLKSAIANADQSPEIDVDTLVVKNIYVDEGPSMKRFRARAMGRATRILKRSCHITVILEEA